MEGLAELAIGGVLVVPLIMGIVQFSKKFGVDGNWCIVETVLLGILLGGVAYGIDQSLIPSVAVPYIKWVIFALSVGLGAAGLYDVGKTRFGTQ